MVPENDISNVTFYMKFVKICYEGETGQYSESMGLDTSS